MKKLTKIIILFVVMSMASIAFALDEEGKIYTVKKGDTLSEICEKMMEGGTPGIYEREAKRAGLKNPHFIYPGLILNLPFVYRIAWRSAYSGCSSHGEWFLEKKVVLDWIDFLNQGYPIIPIMHNLEKK